MSSISFIIIEDIGRAERNKELLLDDHDIQTASKKVINLRENYSEDIIIQFLDTTAPNYGSTTNDRVQERAEIITCAAGTSRAAILSNGKVYPCIYGVDFNEFEYGDICTDNLASIWSSNKWNLFRGSVKLDQLTSCRSCANQSKCDLKICRLKALAHEGDFYGHPKHCEIELINK